MSSIQCGRIFYHSAFEKWFEFCTFLYDNKISIGNQCAHSQYPRHFIEPIWFITELLVRWNERTNIRLTSIGCCRIASRMSYSLSCGDEMWAWKRFQHRTKTSIIFYLTLFIWFRSHCIIASMPRGSLTPVHSWFLFGWAMELLGLLIKFTIGKLCSVRMSGKIIQSIWVFFLFL